jgi:hypothetical protein
MEADEMEVYNIIRESITLQQESHCCVLSGSFIHHSHSLAATATELKNTQNQQNKLPNTAAPKASLFSMEIHTMYLL